MKRKSLRYLCCIFMAVMLAGCGDTPSEKHSGTLPEKMVLMDGKEGADWLQDKKMAQVKEILDEDGTLYEENPYGLTTTTVDTFLGYDCIYGLDICPSFGKWVQEKSESYEAPDFSGAWYPYFHLAFADDATLKKGRKEIEEFFEGQQVKKYGPWKADAEIYGKSTSYTTYVLERTDKDAEKWFVNGEDDDAGGKLYKFVDIAFLHLDGEMAEQYFSRFSNEKTYSQNVCMIMVYFRKMTEGEEIQWVAQKYQYDLLAEEEIDLEKFRESANLKILEDGRYDEEWFDWEIMGLYFMEKYKFDIFSGTYIKDEEKKKWYIKEYMWDIDADTDIDLSEYANSPEVYSAVNDNYNLETSKPFESELERALYLAKKAFYNPDTKWYFNSEEEIRLWFMKKYYCDYDTDTGSATELGKDLAEALVAYQEFIDENEDWKTCALIYLDGDDIPELVTFKPDWFSPDLLSDSQMYTYHLGKLEECNVRWSGYPSFYYKERKNCFRVGGGNMGYYFDIVCNLLNGKWVTVFYGEEEILDWDTMEANYYVNKNKVTKEEYDEAYKKAFPYEYGEYQDTSDLERYSNVLNAYDAIRK